MHKYIILLLVLIALGSHVQAQGIRISNGTTFKIIEAQQTIVLKDGAHFHNDAPVDGEKLVLTFSGTDTSFIEGTGVLSVARIEMNKSEATAKLLKDLPVTERIGFSSGLIDLNGYNIILADTALLTGESESSRIVGDSGYVQITKSLSTPLAENPANLGLIITSGAEWGTTVIRRSPQKMVNAGAVGGIKRSFQVIPELNADLSAFLRMYYLDGELDGLTEEELDFYGTTEATSTWDYLGRVSGNITANFVNINGVDSISFLTLSSIDAPLPLTMHKFKADCNQEGVILQWSLEDGEEGASLHVEYSVDGSVWENIGVISVNRDMTTYQYVDVNRKGTSHYRVKYSGYNGSELYSPVITLNCADAASSFELVENPVKSNLNLDVSLKEAEMVYVSIVDMSGRALFRQPYNLQSGYNYLSIDASGFSAGMYIIMVNSNGGLNWQRKFVKD